MFIFEKHFDFVKVKSGHCFVPSEISIVITYGMTNTRFFEV